MFEFRIQKPLELMSPMFLRWIVRGHRQNALTEHTKKHFYSKKKNHACVNKHTHTHTHTHTPVSLRPPIGHVSSFPSLLSAVLNSLPFNVRIIFAYIYIPVNV